MLRGVMWCILFSDFPASVRMRSFKHSYFAVNLPQALPALLSLEWECQRRLSEDVERGQQSIWGKHICQPKFARSWELRCLQYMVRTSSLPLVGSATLPLLSLILNTLRFSCGLPSEARPSGRKNASLLRSSNLEHELILTDEPESWREGFPKIIFVVDTLECDCARRASAG